MLEKLLKKTKFKTEAAEIAHKLERVGLTMANISDAPTRLGYWAWGQISSYELVAELLEAQNKPNEEKVTRKLTTPVAPAESEE